MAWITNHVALLIAAIAIAIIVSRHVTLHVRRKMLVKQGFISLDLLLRSNNIEEQDFWQACKDLGLKPKLRWTKGGRYILEKDSRSPIHALTARNSAVTTTLANDISLASAAALLTLPSLLSASPPSADESQSPSEMISEIDISDIEGTAQVIAVLKLSAADRWIIAFGFARWVDRNLDGELSNAIFNAGRFANKEKRRALNLSRSNLTILHTIGRMLYRQPVMLNRALQAFSALGDRQFHCLILELSELHVELRSSRHPFTYEAREYHAGKRPSTRGDLDIGNQQWADFLRQPARPLVRRRPRFQPR